MEIEKDAANRNSKCSSPSSSSSESGSSSSGSCFCMPYMCFSNLQYVLNLLEFGERSVGFCCLCLSSSDKDSVERHMIQNIMYYFTFLMRTLKDIFLMQNFKFATPRPPLFSSGLWPKLFLALKRTTQAMVFHVPCHLTETWYFQASLCLCEVCFAP